MLNALKWYLGVLVLTAYFSRTARFVQNINGEISIYSLHINYAISVVCFFAIQCIWRYFQTSTANMFIGIAHVRLG